MKKIDYRTGTMPELVYRVNELIDKLEAQEKEIETINGKHEKEKQQNCRWIPCIERLPYSYVDVLCCLKNGHIVIGFADANSLKMKSYFKIYDENPIVAWMPLPEPYEKLPSDYIDEMIAQQKEEQMNGKEQGRTGKA